jgi:conjugal transfer ATP-binding protein TraC
MSYDIPPPLQHKEKIMFGLTFIQLAYAFGAFLIIFFLMFKTSLDIYISGSIGAFIVTVAVFFMFFDGKNKIINFVNFLKNREIKVNSEKLKEIVDVDEIKEDVIITSKTKTAILEVIPLNFMIKTEEEKEAIISGFQKFLNSLDFPIQIHISSHDISLRAHFIHLKEKMKNLKDLFEDYCSFVKNSIKENNIKNRRFYIVINEKYDLEIQTKVCEDKLKSIGLKVKRLNNKELTRLFYENVANKKEKKLKEDETVENFTHFLLSPEKVSFFQDYFQIDKQVCKVLSVSGYPFSVEMGFLDKIVSSGENYDISLHIEPFEIDATMVKLNRELQKQQADLYADSKKGILNPSLEIKYKSTKGVLEDLQKGKQKLFNVSLYLMSKGEDLEKAKLLSKKIKADLDGLMIQSKIPSFEMINSYESMLPLARDSLKQGRNVHTQGLSAFFPFSSPFLDIDDEGTLLGLNKNKIPYIKDIFSLSNANGIVLATSGSGKSYFTKLLLSRQFMNGCQIIIIDPQGEYLAITEHYMGEIITISKNSETIINPLDLMGHEYLEKRLSLMDLFQIMFGDLTEIQKAILDKAVDLTYDKKGITRDLWKGKKAPKMEDLFQTLKNLERNCASQERVTYRALLNRLGMYTDKGVFSFLNRDTNINFDNKFVCFNIGSMPKQVKPIVMYLVLDFVYMRMKKSLKRKLLVIDEAWSMLQRAEESSYVFEIVKTCRKYNLGLLMITQDVADLVASKAGHAVLANTSYTFLLRQKPAVVGSVVKAFNLSKAERDHLLSAERGQGILILENEHQEIEVIASPKEHELITTNPDEMVKKAENKKGVVKELDDTNIILDIEQDVHSAWDKTIEEKLFLANQEYKLGSYVNFRQKRQASYFVKEHPPESRYHTFYVNLIYDEIKKYTNKVEKSVTKNADIIFMNKCGEKIAIEVETAFKVHTSSKKKYHNEKFWKRKKQYNQRCYIFLMKSNLKNSYKRHKLPILIRNNFLEFIKLQFSGLKNLDIVQKLG